MSTMASWALLSLRLLRERRLLVWSVAAGGVAVLALQIAVYPSIRDSLDEMSETLPDSFTAMMGTAEFSSPQGFLQAETYGLMAPLLVMIVAVSTGASGVAGSEENGRLTMLATAGISRRAIGVAAATAMVAAVTLVTVAYWCATIGGGIFGDIDIGIAELTAAALSLWALGIAVGGLSFAVATGLGRRGVAVAVSSALAIGSFVAYGLLPLVGGLEWARHISLWFPYAEHQPLWNGFDISSFVILVGIGSAAAAVGITGLERRDLR